MTRLWSREEEVEGRLLLPDSMSTTSRKSSKKVMSEIHNTGDCEELSHRTYSCLGWILFNACCDEKREAWIPWWTVGYNIHNSEDEKWIALRSSDWQQSKRCIGTGSCGDIFDTDVGKLVFNPAEDSEVHYMLGMLACIPWCFLTARKR